MWRVLAWGAGLIVALVVVGSIAAGLTSQRFQAIHVLLLVSIGVISALYRRSKRHTVKLADDVLKDDTRAPVIYLRPFDADRSAGEHEKSLSKLFSSVGPVIAIGRPGEKLPPLGAYRAYVDHHDWQTVVSSLIKHSRLTILRVGQTEGVLWEVKHAIEHCRPEQLVFLVPPPGQACDEFREKVSAILPRPLPPNVHRRAVQGVSSIVHFLDDWTPELVPLRAPFLHGGGAEAKFAHAFQPVFDRIGAPWKRTYMSSIGLWGWSFFVYVLLLVPSFLFTGLLAALIGALFKVPDSDLFPWIVSSIVLALPLIYLVLRKWRDAAYWRTRHHLGELVTRPSVPPIIWLSGEQ